MSLESSNMASESGSVGFCGFLPDAATANWYADSFTFEDVLLADNFFESLLPSLPPPVSTGEFRPTFSSEVLPETPPVLGVNRNGLPALPAASGAPNIRPRTPPAEGVKNRYKGTSEAEWWFTGDQPPPAVIPALTPSAPPLPSTTTSRIDWVKVPQRNYDHGRKQWNFNPSEPIPFRTNGRPGINLEDALSKKFKDLDGKDDPMLRGASGAISCRLLFPGYPDNGYACQIHTLSWTRNRLPIKRSKLAYEVAKKLHQYLNHMARIIPDESIEDQWRIGRGFMHIDNMFLVKLVPVSKGSFQPEIWVTNPSASRVRAGRR